MENPANPRTATKSGGSNIGIDQNKSRHEKYLYLCDDVIIMNTRVLVIVLVLAFALVGLASAGKIIYGPAPSGPVVTSCSIKSSCCSPHQTYTPPPYRQTTCCDPIPAKKNTVFPINPTGCPEMPRMPHSFGGCVYIDGMPAPEGTVIEARGKNVNPSTSVLTLTSHCFGQGPFDPKLIVQGVPVPGGMLNVPDGTDITFYVNGEKAQVCENGRCQTYYTFHSGWHTNLDFNIVTH